MPDTKAKLKSIALKAIVRIIEVNEYFPYRSSSRNLHVDPDINERVITDIRCQAFDDMVRLLAVSEDE